METFANILKELREESGLSLKKVAAAVGASDAAVYKWESGLAEPKVCYLIKLAELFDCTVDCLVGKTDEHEARTSVSSSFSAPTKNEQRLLVAYRKLSHDKQTLLTKTAEAWIDN